MNISLKSWWERELLQHVEFPESKHELLNFFKTPSDNDRDFNDQNSQGIFNLNQKL